MVHTATAQLVNEWGADSVSTTAPTNRDPRHPGQLDAQDSGTFPPPSSITSQVSTNCGDQQPTDRELVVRAARRQREAFVTIYRRYHSGIYRFARSMTGSVTMAEDVTQDVFLALIRNIDRYDPGRGTLATYLFAIARNVSRYKLRRERRFVGLNRLTAQEMSALDNPARNVMRSQTVSRVRACIRDLSSRYSEVLILCDLHELSHESHTVSRVRACIRDLSSRYREVLILCDLHGLSHEEVAVVLNVPMGTVRSRLHRARQQLSERMTQMDRCVAPPSHETRKCLI